jgi:phosphatidate cytidylyltransferase
VTELAWVRRWRPSPLVVRILSGSVILLAALFLFYLGPYGVYAMAVTIGGLALWEFQRLSEKLGYKAPTWLLYPLGAYFVFSGTLLRDLDTELVLSLALVAGLGAFLFLPGQRQGLGRWAMGLAGALYIGMPFNYYLLLYASSQEHGLAWLLVTLLAAAASDVAALLVGMRFGRHRFFPAISPRKTLEGAAAGVAFAILVVLLGAYGVLGLSIWHAVALGLLVGLSAEVGDLVESQMKRLAGVKDSSNLIPGHGGVLDRLDSLLFPPILVYVYALAFHLLR